MKRAAEPSTFVSIVTFHDEEFLGPCLESVGKQTFPCRVRVVDNASSEVCCGVARKYGVPLIRCPENLGFSGGHNRNLEDVDSEYILLLNADVKLNPDFVEVLVSSMRADSRIGMAGGKLFRMTIEGCCLFGKGGPVLDSTGIFFTPAQRHFDRGSGEVDSGQYNKRQTVFGITGAAVLCRRAMIDDLTVNGEFLDADFFAYREDADLAWRAQLKGWKALYEPAAVGLHARRVTPARRRRLEPGINFHSLKNRYLMRIKNMDAAVRRRCFPYMWLRDIGILAYVLLFEHGSLEAYREVSRLYRKMKVKRKIVQGNRRVSSAEIARWFRFRPVAFDYQNRPAGDPERSS